MKNGFMYLAAAGLAVFLLDGCATGKKLVKVFTGGGDAAEIVCTLPYEEYLGAVCPAVAGGTWKAQQLCHHGANVAYSTKMIACIADDVLVAPGSKTD